MSLVCLVGKSGVGKSTIETELVSKHGYKKVVSYTSRPMGENEVNGKDYIYVSRKEMEDMIENGDFPQYNENYGNLYATPKLDFINNDYVLVVIPDGLRQLKSKLPAGIIKSFYLTADKDELKRRSLGRGRDTEEKIDSRAMADEELFLGTESMVDYIIDCNGSLEENVEKILNILK